MSQASCRLAIDVGGTFTDVVLVDDGSAEVWFAKILSTPADPSEGSLTGAGEILQRTGISSAAVRDVVHATTVATNAVLEGKGARTGMIATAGFRDALEMGREARYDIYDLGLRMPAPLVPRQRRMEVNERVDFDGNVLTPLDEGQVADVLTQLVRDAGIESLAICLLHGYAHPAHEVRVAEIVARLYPNLTVSVSHQVSAEVREFERTSTTVVDAYVKPLVQTYVGRLNKGLADLGMRQEASMMLSHGGIGPASDVADTFPVRMIESGPAAGAIAAAHFAREALEQPDAIAFDMGGTTAKISVIQDGEPAITHEFEVGHVHRFKRGSGFPLQISAIELLEIGAGGGSIAHVNDLGLLNVGPKSAGADPGPVCYARGGAQPTVTDADLLLGYLDPAHFLGGDMALDEDAVKAAIEADIAGRLDMSVEQIAWGIHDVVNESMAAAIRAHGAEKGIDLRNFAMIAFGGAGPVHAYALARKLGLRRLLCPFGAGVASAIGCLAALPAVELVTAYFARLDAVDWGLVRDHYLAMRRGGEEALAKLIGGGSEIVMQRSIDMRCQGQGYSVTVPISDDDGEIALSELNASFAEIYQNVYGHQPPDVPLEVVGLRARVLNPRSKLEIAPGTEETAGSALKGRRQVYFEAAGGYVETAIYDRYHLPLDEVFDGPAIIEERETSIVTGPDTTFHLDAAANIIIDFKE
ncbi:MAG: hydantoinase/oxoprolinase family protein [Alphaproteobacteria bacterium]|jgi:N-methylhydantoinase A|nr:hydantoinase/oxoprolinase family protein [Alphaproteobacteria bacterium]MDP7462294.1 hydantoinase/oxoprolinase family protein [Alphaproteobacteria bacterium]